MDIFSMVMEAMAPTIDENYCSIEGAMESDTDCFEQLRAACGAPKYEAPENRVRMMSATEALNQLSSHARIASGMDPQKKERVDYSAAFEAINATLDTSINPEMRDEIMAAKRNEALSFYDALEAFMTESEEESAMEGKMWDRFMNSGAGQADKTAVYDINYQPRGKKNLSDFQLYVVETTEQLNDLHKTYPHIFIKRGAVAKLIRKFADRFGDSRLDYTHMLYWVDPGTTGDPKDAVCVATADINSQHHVIFDISVRAEFQRYGLMNQILDYIVQEYHCNEAATDKQYGEITNRNIIAETALSKAGFTKVGEDEYETFWRKGNPMPGSFFMSDKKHPV